MRMDRQALMCHVMSSAQLNSLVVHFFVVSSEPSLPNVSTTFGAARKLSFHRFHCLQHLSVALLLQNASDVCSYYSKLSCRGHLKLTLAVILCLCNRLYCRQFSFALQWRSQKFTLQLLRCHQWKFIHGCLLHEKCRISIFMCSTGLFLHIFCN